MVELRVLASLPSKSAHAGSRNLSESCLRYTRLLLILTYESPGALLHNLDAEGAGGMRLVAIALHRHVALGEKGPVHAAVVVVPKKDIGWFIGQQRKRVWSHGPTCSVCTDPRTKPQSVSVGLLWSCIGSTWSPDLRNDFETISSTCASNMSQVHVPPVTNRFNRSGTTPRSWTFILVLYI